MSEHANAVLMRRGYEAFGSGDLETLTGLFADNAAWHEPGSSLIAGDYIGRDRVFEFFGKLAGLSGGTFKRRKMVFNRPGKLVFTCET